MPNPYFSFKQFTVYHHLCAMKVGIDGVLLGAWADAAQASSVLDIGTGSGLIALMIAQRTNAQITAIDIDSDAVKQATENFRNSPWAERLSAQKMSVQEYADCSLQKFDLIVSNPPFFINSLKAPDAQRNTARHTDTLTHTELINCSEKILSNTGKICLILPVNEGYDCVNYAQTQGLYCNKIISVYPKPGAEVKRLLIELGREKLPCHNAELTIETDTRHEYSAEFIQLAKEYYLKL